MDLWIPLRRLLGMFLEKGLIRYVGGLLSTIELLKAGFAGPSFDKAGIAAIQKQVVTLVQKLAPGYSSFKQG